LLLKYLTNIILSFLFWFLNSLLQQQQKVSKANSSNVAQSDVKDNEEAIEAPDDVDDQQRKLIEQLCGDCNSDVEAILKGQLLLHCKLQNQIASKIT